MSRTSSHVTRYREEYALAHGLRVYIALDEPERLVHLRERREELAAPVPRLHRQEQMLMPERGLHAHLLQSGYHRRDLAHVLLQRAAVLDRHLGAYLLDRLARIGRLFGGGLLRRDPRRVPRVLTPGDLLLRISVGCAPAAINTLRRRAVVRLDLSRQFQPSHVAREGHVLPGLRLAHLPQALRELLEEILAERGLDVHGHAVARACLERHVRLLRYPLLKLAYHAHIMRTPLVQPRLLECHHYLAHVHTPCI